MKAKICLQAGTKETISEAFEQYISDRKGRELSDKSIDTYRHHFNAIRYFLDMEIPIGELSHKDTESMISKMREWGYARYSISSYL